MLSLTFNIFLNYTVHVEPELLLQSSQNWMQQCLTLWAFVSSPLTRSTNSIWFKRLCLGSETFYWGRRSHWVMIEVVLLPALLRQGPDAPWNVLFWCFCWNPTRDNCILAENVTLIMAEMGDVLERESPGFEPRQHIKSTYDPDSAAG